MEGECRGSGLLGVSGVDRCRVVDGVSRMLGDRCGMGLPGLLLPMLGLVLVLLLIRDDNSLSVGLPGEGHRSSIFFYYMQCSLLHIHFDH